MMSSGNGQLHHRARGAASPDPDRRLGATQAVGACTGHYTVIATADGFIGFQVP